MPQGVEKEDEMADRNDTNINRRSYLKMVGAGAGFSAGGTGLTSLGTQSVRATQESPCNTVDDFEDSDLSEYEFDQGSSGASLVTSPTYSGAYALEISGTNTEMISMEGLEHYPAAGDVFSTWLQGTNGADQINISYGVQNHINRYIVRVDFENDELAIWRHEDGTSHVREKKTSGFTLSQDTWYEIQVEWKTDGTHALTLFDENGNQITELSATDPTWTAGGIGYDAYLGDGGAVYFDHMQVKSGREIVSANKVIDSFEDNDLAEYDFDRGSAGASVVSSPTYGGSSVLEISGTNTELISTSGLDHYPSAGDVFSCWVRGTGGVEDIHLTYGVQDHDSRYFARIDIADNDLFLFKYDNGNFHQLAEDASVSLAEDTWYNLEVDWRKTGTHIVTVYDCDGKEVAQITGSDSTWTSGGIGYDAYLESSGGTVYFNYVAIHSSVLDDFEDGNVDEYDGDTGAFTVQSAKTIEGNLSLEGTTAQSTIALTNATTSRGEVFKTSVVMESGSSAKPGLVTCSQDPAAPLQDCYYLLADPANDALFLYRRDNGQSVLLDQSTMSIDKGKEYQLVVELRDSLVIGAIEDAAGTEIAGVAEADATYTDGHLGVHLEGGAPAYFDLLTKHPLWIEMLDTYEDGTLQEYSGDTAYYKVQSSTALRGGYSLECTNNYTGIAHDTAETVREQTYSCRTVAGSNSGARPGLLACVQDTQNPIDNCYWAQMNPGNDELRLYLRKGGSSTLLDSRSLSISEGMEYQLAISFSKKEVKALLFKKNGQLIGETDSISDTTFTSGTFGFYTGGSGAPAYYDSVQKSPVYVERITEVSTSTSVAKDAVQTSVAQEVLGELNNPSYDTSNATRENVYPTGQANDAHLIAVPTEYGELVVEYNDNSAERATAYLDRSSLPSSLISDLSDDFGWPDTEKGEVYYEKGGSKPWFTRSVTDTEEEDVVGLMNSQEGRTDGSHVVRVRNNGGGVYRALYHDTLYHVNQSVTSITKDEELFGSPSCQNLKKQCQKEKVFSDTAAVRTAVFCAIGGPIGCAHGIGITVVSAVALELGGPCTRYNKKCKT